ncbi:hypothetical protein CMI38_05060 [Candidatus Pacearchaeota archaeon]|jgi:hypothetical protein|nr:hypothetical protein [Candidatus Pacearchaeota archaeon]|tara:strand:- start:12466 stop:12960 length:495 start_codon:yes stop_codon:yes gene_type:complete
MKRNITLFGILVLAAFLVSGVGCVEDMEDNLYDLSIDDDSVNKNDVVIGAVVSEKVLVDRTRYVQAGNPPFDMTNVIFVNEVGKGYKIEVMSGSELKVDVMTDKDCLLKAQGDDFNVITTEQGTEVVMVNEVAPEEDQNICVSGEAMGGEGQIEIKFKVTELNY